jgi:Na+-driven multidrug efflux pump
MSFCLMISLIGLLFRRQLLDWVNAPQEIQGMALSYLTIIMATLVFQFFINWMNASFKSAPARPGQAAATISGGVHSATMRPALIMTIRSQKRASSM